MITHILFAIAFTLTASPKDETIRSYGAGVIEWQLVAINDVPFSERATLHFPKAGQMSGAAPCNRFTTQVIVPYPWFETGPIAATRMACPDLEAESVYFQALEAASLAKVEDGQLILSNDDGLRMVFIPVE